MTDHIPLKERPDDGIAEQAIHLEHLLRYKGGRDWVYETIIDLAKADHVRHPQVPKLVMEGMQHMERYHPGLFEPLLIAAANHCEPGSKLERLLTERWTQQQTQLSLTDRSELFPKLKEAFGHTTNLHLRTAVGQQLVRVSFYHATSDQGLTEVRDALMDVNNFAAEHGVRKLQNESLQKLSDFNKQVFALGQPL